MSIMEEPKRYRILFVPGLTDLEHTSALLPLSPTLMASMKAAVRARRELDNDCGEINDKQKATLSFRRKVEDRIDVYRIRREKLQGLVQEHPRTRTYFADLYEVEEQLSKLDLLLDTVDREQDKLVTALMRRVSADLQAQEEANDYLEDALVHGGELPPSCHRGGRSRSVHYRFEMWTRSSASSIACQLATPTNQ